MRIDVITIFPEYFAPLSVSLIGKAAQRGDITFGVHDLRQWTHDAHHTVDDSPFGGGPGMVMRPEPWGEALDALAGSAPGPAAASESGGQAAASGNGPLLVIPSPAGVPFTQRRAASYAAEPWLVFACGRYEGIDGRVALDARLRMRVDEVSIGDYVLAGGEAAVLVMTEAICRLLPGVLGNAESAADDSFGSGAVGRLAGLVEGAAYTRPRVWRGLEVPPVLLSGDHAAIARWRRDSALLRTARNRPDLIARLARGQGPAVTTTEPAVAETEPAAAQAEPAATKTELQGPSQQLDDHDRSVLAEAGFPVTREDVAHLRHCPPPA